MKRWMLVVSMAAVMAASAFGQSKQSIRHSSNSFRGMLCVLFHPVQFYALPQPPRPAAQPAGNLEQVLNLLDKASAGFKTVQTDFEWDQYQKVVDEHDIQSGVMYFRRSGSSVEMSARILKPEPKYVLFTGEELQVYLPKADQVTRYLAGKNRQDFEAYLVLGFGGRGHDLPKNFEVRYAGVENVDGVATYKLELVPKAQRARGMFRLITLWIDQQTGLSVQQRFQESGDDYRIAKYKEIKLNRKLPDDAFKLKTTGRTKYITPNS